MPCKQIMQIMRLKTLIFNPSFTEARIHRVQVQFVASADVLSRGNVFLTVWVLLVHRQMRTFHLVRSAMQCARPCSHSLFAHRLPTDHHLSHLIKVLLLLMGGPKNLVSPFNTIHAYSCTFHKRHFHHLHSYICHHRGQLTDTFFIACFVFTEDGPSHRRSLDNKRLGRSFWSSGSPVFEFRNQ